MIRKTVYLVRHGAVDYSPGHKRYVGQLDLGLSPEGERQAEGVGRILSDIRLAGIWCSDLLRSRRTAELIGEPQGLRPEATSDLREIAMGEWEGLSFAEIARQYPEDYEARGRDLTHWRPPGGESVADCSRRVLKAFGSVTDSLGSDLLIVGHAAVNRIILCHVLGMPMENLFRIGQDYGCLNVIQQKESGCRVTLLNARPGDCGKCLGRSPVEAAVRFR
jgi:alpha-ribazole phosphatase